MIYAILIYGSEAQVAAWSAEEEREVLGRHAQLRQDLVAAGQLGPVLRLSPTAGKVVRRYKERTYITDGPFAETKEQLMGLYVLECDRFEEVLAAAERLAFTTGVIEIRPITWLNPGGLAAHMPERDR